MTVMQNTERYPNGDPIVHKKVLLKLWSAPAYDEGAVASYEAIGEVHTDEDGYWEAELAPTDDLIPTGQIYLAEIVFRGGTIQHRFIVPDLGSTEWVGDHLADPPGALETAALAAHLLDPTAHAGTQHPNLAAHDALGLATQTELQSVIDSLSEIDFDTSGLVQKTGDTMTGTLALQGSPAFRIEGITSGGYGAGEIQFAVRNLTAPTPLLPLYNFAADADYSDLGVQDGYRSFWLKDLVTSRNVFVGEPTKFGVYLPTLIQGPTGHPLVTSAANVLTLQGGVGATGDVLRMVTSANTVLGRFTAAGKFFLGAPSPIADVVQIGSPGATSEFTYGHTGSMLFASSDPFLIGGSPALGGGHVTMVV